MTAQVSEQLIYGGKAIPLFTNPLSLYLRYADISFDSPHTANWRGYVSMNTTCSWISSKGFW